MKYHSGGSSSAADARDVADAADADDGDSGGLCGRAFCILPLLSIVVSLSSAALQPARIYRTSASFVTGTANVC